MEIEIYLDSLFFLNLMINLWILRLLKKKFSLEAGHMRRLCAAAIGAGAYVLSFGVSGGGIYLQAVVVALSAWIMARVLVPGRKKQHLFQIIGWGFAYGFLIAGILRAVFAKWRLFGGHITVSGVLAGAYICMLLGEYLIKVGKRGSKCAVCRVVLCGKGGEISLDALLDTGNSLTEPVSRRPVCIVEEELLAHITLENPLFLRAVPYRSVGCERGILYGVEVPEVRIYLENTCYRVKNVICAGIPHTLSAKGKYRMILHPALVTEENSECEKGEQNVFGERNEKNNLHAGRKRLVP